MTGLKAKGQPRSTGSSSKRKVKKKRPSTPKHIEAWIIIDEIGEVGKKPKRIKGKIYEPTKTYGFGFSIIKNPDKFSKVRENFDYKNPDTAGKGTRKLKDHKKIELAHDIRISGAKTHGTSFDKMNRPPKGWSQIGKDVQIGMLQKTIDHALSKTKCSKVTIVVEDHNSYHENGINVAESMSEYYGKKYRKNVTMITAKKSDKVYSKHLAANDAVAHATFLKEERKEPKMSYAMGQKVKKYDRRDSIIRKRV